MGARYNSDAIEKCQELYLLFNGGQHERIQEEMRKAGWEGWSKANLYTRGKGKNKKLGWIEKFNWEQALKMKIATSSEGAATSAELLFLELEKVRRMLNKEIATKGTAALRKENRDLLYQHRDYSKLCIDALARLEAARDNLAGFAKFWENLLSWLPSISEKALRELLKIAEPVIERARLEYASDSDKK